MASLTISTSYADSVGWQCDNTYARLSVALFASARPAMVPIPRISIINIRLDKELHQDQEAIPPEAIEGANGGSE